MNFCSNCGSENKSKGNFCASCGMKLSIATSPQEDSRPVASGEAASNTTEEKKTNKNIFLLLYDTIFKETNVENLTKFFYILLLVDFLVAYFSRNLGIIIDPEFPTNPAYFLGACVGFMALSYVIINILSIRYRLPIFTLGFSLLNAVFYILQLGDSIELGRASLLANTHSVSVAPLLIFFDLFISGVLEILVLLRIFIVLRK